MWEGMLLLRQIFSAIVTAVSNGVDGCGCGCANGRYGDGVVQRRASWWTDASWEASPGQRIDGEYGDWTRYGDQLCRGMGADVACRRCR